MAKKTMLRQLISKWGIMSIDLSTGFDADGKTISADDSGNLVPDEEPVQQDALPEAAVQQPSAQSEPQKIDLNAL